MNYFADKTVVVIGATGILGQLIAHDLCERSADARLIVRSPDLLATMSLNPEGFLPSFTGVAADMAIADMGAYCEEQLMQGKQTLWGVGSAWVAQASGIIS